jgi:hypothetical protein
MFTRLLNLCGLYLGPERDLMLPAPDNQDGFWENLRFVALNDAILAQLDGAWDVPPKTVAGWEQSPELIMPRLQAHALIEQFAGREPWGWKDPRNSLTLAFWRDLLPGMKVCICLRNPLEVAQSLEKRNGVSLAMGLNLWLEYHQQLLAAVPTGQRIVTHYDSYFHDAPRELSRVLQRLEIPASEKLIAEASNTVCGSIRHIRVRTQSLLEARLPEEVLSCYLNLCAEAGPVHQEVLEYDPVAETSNLSTEAGGRSFFTGLRILQLETEVRTLRKQVIEKAAALTHAEADVQAMRREMSGAAWALVCALRRLWRTLAPPGSVRERLLRACARAPISAVRGTVRLGTTLLRGVARSLASTGTTNNSAESAPPLPDRTSDRRAA